MFVKIKMRNCPLLLLDNRGYKGFTEKNYHSSLSGVLKSNAFTSHSSLPIPTSTLNSHLAPHLLNVVHKVVEDNPHVIAGVDLLDLHISVNVAVHEELNIGSFHLRRKEGKKRRVQVKAYQRRRGYTIETKTTSQAKKRPKQKHQHESLYCTFCIALICSETPVCVMHKLQTYVLVHIVSNLTEVTT